MSTIDRSAPRRLPPPPSKNGRHKHPEAFCLMAYMSDDGRIIEWIWNSRDGVTPFIVHSRDGSKQMSHVSWERDIYHPEHELQVGDRYFATHSEQSALDAAKRQVETNWDRMRDAFSSRSEAIEYFASTWVGSPTLLVKGGAA